MPDDGIPHAHFRPTRQQSPPVNSATERFFDLVRKVHGEPFALSWLASGLIEHGDGVPPFQNCEFTDDTIHTTGVGAERLHRACQEQMKAANVRVLHCKLMTERMAIWARKRANLLKAKGRK